MIWKQVCPHANMRGWRLPCSVKEFEETNCLVGSRDFTSTPSAHLGPAEVNLLLTFCILYRSGSSFGQPSMWDERCLQFVLLICRATSPPLITACICASRHLRPRLTCVRRPRVRHLRHTTADLDPRKHGNSSTGAPAHSSDEFYPVEYDLDSPVYM